MSLMTHARGTYLNQDENVKFLTPRPEPFLPPAAKKALFSSLILGNVNKNFQDRAGLGRPLSDPLFKPLHVLRAGQATAYMARVQTSKQGHRAFPLTSGEETKGREPTSPSAIARWSQATGVTWVRGGAAGHTADPSALRVNLKASPCTSEPADRPPPEPCRISPFPDPAGHPRVHPSLSSSRPLNSCDKGKDDFLPAAGKGRGSPPRLSCLQVCKPSLGNSTVCMSFLFPRNTFQSLSFFYSLPSTFCELRLTHGRRIKSTHRILPSKRELCLLLNNTFSSDATNFALFTNLICHQVTGGMCLLSPWVDLCGRLFTRSISAVFLLHSQRWPAWILWCFPAFP